MLKFSQANTKTKKLYKVFANSYLKDKKLYSFDLPAGYTCPGAKDCKSYAVVKNGKTRIKDSKTCKFRCFSASAEVTFPAVYRSRQHNYTQLKGKALNELINY